MKRSAEKPSAIYNKVVYSKQQTDTVDDIYLADLQLPVLPLSPLYLPRLWWSNSVSTAGMSLWVTRPHPSTFYQQHWHHHSEHTINIASYHITTCVKLSVKDSNSWLMNKIIHKKMRIDEIRHETIIYDVRNAVRVSKMRRRNGAGCWNECCGNTHFNSTGHCLCTRLVVKPALVNNLVNK